MTVSESHDKHLPPHPASPPVPTKNAGAMLEIEIGALLGERREAILLHNGEAYRLRVTANNKLILTK